MHTHVKAEARTTHKQESKATEERDSLAVTRAGEDVRVDSAMVVKKGGTSVCGSGEELRPCGAVC